MAWDLFIYRYLTHKMSFIQNETYFRIPIFASLDKKLLNFMDICPIKAYIHYPNHQHFDFVFDDENEFGIALREAMDLTNFKVENDLNRMNHEWNIQLIEENIVDLEKQLREFERQS
jgi:hypothetical protein